MNKDKKLLFGGINLIFLLLAFFIWTLNGCGGSGGGGNGGGGNGGTTPTIITWTKSYGGNYDDEAYSIQQTEDGGYVIAGVTQQDSNYEILVIKIDAHGNLIWQYTQPGIANSIINSEDGYIVTGLIDPSPIGKLGIIKLNSIGEKVWEKNYGAYGGIANEVRKTSDGGYIVVGELLEDVYILKTDAYGNLAWGKTFGESDKRETGYSIEQTSDGFIIAGERILTDSDILIFKIDSNGNSIGGLNINNNTGYDACYSIKLTSDGGYIAAGKKSSPAGDADVWVAKLKVNGELEWQKTYEGIYNEVAYSVYQTRDGGFILAGEIGIDTDNTKLLIMKLDANGELIWQKPYGVSGKNNACSIQQTADGGYIVAGKTTTSSGDTDFWILKLDPNGNLN